MKYYSSQGMSLIEFTITLIVIGIISSVIIAVFYDASEDAYQDTLDSIANSLTAASATNYRLSRSGSPGAVSITNCTDTADTLKYGNQVPSGYNIISASVSLASEATCTISAPNGDTANFQAIGTS